MICGECGDRVPDPLLMAVLDEVRSLRRLIEAHPGGNGGAPSATQHAKTARVRDFSPRTAKALNKTQAARYLGISPEHFDKHVLPDVRVVRVGRRFLVTVAELDKWLEENAERTLASDRARD